MSHIDKGDLSDILAALTRLEERVSRLERALGMSPAAAKQGKREEAPASQHEEMELEFKIGELWFSRLGTIFLLIGAGFFISYPIPGLPPLLVGLLGYGAVSLLFLLARYWRNNFEPLSRLVFAGALVLLFYASLHLHYFTDQPLIGHRALDIVLVLVVLGFELFLVLRRRDALLSMIVLISILVAALIFNISSITLLLITGTALLSAMMAIRYDWLSIGFWGLVSAFIAHAFWLTGNPFGSGGALAGHSFNLIYLITYAAVFGLLNLFRKEKLSDFYEVLFSIVTGMGVFLIGAVNVLKFFGEQRALLAGLTFVYFIALAVLNKSSKEKLYTSSFYANFAFIALSLAIFFQFTFPSYFVWFGLQSLLVIVVALWFHSQIIVLANVVIFLLIFFVYLFFAPSHGFVNLTYAFVALASARILNWKKDRLELKTDSIRNIYLGCAFIIVLYGLFHAVPANFVSLSWIGAAVGYFLLSLALRNIKYRYLAILTVFATIFHVFLVDMRTVQAGFRIILFLAIGVVILVLSLLYANYHKRINQN